jgi:Carboxypeptidase regulatory-like domain/TonB-dependent Receptor Plug Domain
MLKRLAPLSLFIALITTASQAQSNYASLRGEVTDPQHLPVPGAKVHITSDLTGAARNVTTDGAGLYVAGGLQPGGYHVEIDKSGFTAAKQSLQLEVGQKATLDIALSLGPVALAVNVGVNGELLRTADATVGAVVDRDSVQQLPLNGRQLIDLVATVPGAHVSMGAQEGNVNPLYWRPGQFSAVSIAGARPNANYFLLDGATNTDPTFNTQNLNPNPDMVQEFQVQVGSYAADMGGAGGGQINIATRSGTNSFHGTAYEFLRNGAMDAFSFGSMGMTKHLVQNDFGGAVGGPIYKHTFFFVNYEGLRRAAADPMTDTVPTAEEASGDFSDSGVNIYDPSSTYANPDYNPALPVSASNPQSLRKQFEYNGKLNVIPPSELNSASSIMLKQYVPQPNQMSGMMGMNMNGQPTVVGAGNDSNNYLDLRNELHYTDQGTVRVDHDFNNGSTVFVRYSGQGEHGFMPENLPGFGYYHDNLAQQGVLGLSTVISPRMVNTSTLAISRLSMDHTTESANKNDIVSQLGIQGVGFGGPGAWGAPYFTVQGYSPFGDSYSATPMHAWDTIIEGRDSLTFQTGKHTLKFGGVYQWYIWPMWGFFQNRGYYQFTSGFTTETLTNDGTGSALASFLLGMPVVRQRQAGVPQMNLRQWYADGFAQDTLRVTPSTTINYGVRYEYMSPLWDVSYTNSNLDLSSGAPQPFIGGQNGYPRGLMYPNRKNFAPRFGIAQSFGLGLVWHAAYGIFFTPVDMNTWCNQRHNIPYVFPETAQSDNYTPTAAIANYNFGQPVLGKTVVSFTAMSIHPAPQYIQQWSTSLEKSLGQSTTLEIGYIGSGGWHLQRAHLINNAQPGPGLIQPRRPVRSMSFVPGTVFPSNIQVLNPATPLITPVSTINLLENTAQSWYDAGYVTFRHRYARGLSLVANYTYAKNLSNAPDFRSPMYESAIPQNNNDLEAEKGPACDIRHRFALTGVYDIPTWKESRLAEVATEGWRLSLIYQIQTGYPLTISVFGDTANAGTALGENPIRSNYTGQPMFGQGTRNANEWFNTGAFAAPPAYTFGDVGRNSVYGPGMQSLDFALVRSFPITERTIFDLRGEVYNALNKVNLDTPNRFVNTAGFGTITDAMDPARQVQLSARVSF